MESGPHSVTALLIQSGKGDQQALDALMPLMYDELRRIAGGQLRRESAGHTLQSTALVHEAYLRLIDQREVQWQNRAHFFALASKMMRRILVDHVRRQLSGKRGAGAIRLSLEDAPEPGVRPDADLNSLDQ